MFQDRAQEIHIDLPFRVPVHVLKRLPLGLVHDRLAVSVVAMSPHCIMHSTGEDHIGSYELGVCVGETGVWCTWIALSYDLKKPMAFERTRDALDLMLLELLSVRRDASDHGQLRLDQLHHAEERTTAEAAQWIRTDAQDTHRRHWQLDSERRIRTDCWSVREVAVCIVLTHVEQGKMPKVANLNSPYAFNQTLSTLMEALA